MVSLSVLIITYGRKELLLKCLRSLGRPGDDWELVLVANGESLSDEVKELARAMTPRVKEFETPERWTPGRARNLGLDVCEGEWIFFIDDDAYLPPHYWEVARPLLNDPKIEVLGGPDSPAEGMGAFSLALALALSSPFCTGSTFSRHRAVGKKLTLADEEKLTSCNLWVRRNVIGEVKFPEDYQRAEENFFLQQLQGRVRGMYYHPRLSVYHHRRTKLGHLIRPTFLAGHYRSRLLREKLTVGHEVFWLPSAFVFLHLLAIIDMLLFIDLAKFYLVIIIPVSLGLSIKVGKFWLFPLVSFMHYFVVFMYGVGFIYERGLRLFNRQSI